MIRTRRQWLEAATVLPACLALRAARNEFWNSKDAASWSNDEKQLLLGQSPWAREGLVRMEEGKDRRTTPGYGNNGRLGGDVPDTGPGVPPGGVRSVPIGEAPPPPPNPDPGRVSLSGSSTSDQDYCGAIPEPRPGRVSPSPV